MTDNSARRSWLLLTLGMLLVVAALIGGTRTANGTSPTPPPRTNWMRTLCSQEDGNNCAWNAREQGNGLGHSFYVVTRPLRSMNGRIIGKVSCHFFVGKKADRNWSECQVTSTRHHSKVAVNATTTTPTIGTDPNRYIDAYGNTIYAPRLHWSLGTQCVTPGQSDCLLLATDSDNPTGHDVYFRTLPDGQTCQFYKGQTYANNHDACFIAP